MEILLVQRRRKPEFPKCWINQSRELFNLAFKLLDANLVFGDLIHEILS